jgi:hypothetical protein
MPKEIRNKDFFSQGFTDGAACDKQHGFLTLLFEL